jgi:hypothetical protein
MIRRHFLYKSRFATSATAGLPYAIKRKGLHVAHISDDEDCFLTTACVKHLHLPDDCDELQILRGLRDDHMLANHEGRLLIEQYKVFGPAIVKAINNCENAHEIYRYIYEQMILPSVDLVKEGRLQDAAAYYAIFVKALHEKYCGRNASC